MERLTEEQFEEQHDMIQNHFNDNASYNGELFETFGDEVLFVIEKAKENRVVTILDGDEGDIYYVSGMHFVNRIGYLVTTKPLTKEFEVKLDLY
jgi:hypothetical protein